MPFAGCQGPFDTPVPISSYRRCGTSNRTAVPIASIPRTWMSLCHRKIVSCTRLKNLLAHGDGYSRARMVAAQLRHDRATHSKKICGSTIPGCQHAMVAVCGGSHPRHHWARSTTKMVRRRACNANPLLLLVEVRPQELAPRLYSTLMDDSHEQHQSSVPRQTSGGCRGISSGCQPLMIASRADHSPRGVRSKPYHSDAISRHVSLRRQGDSWTDAVGASDGGTEQNSGGGVPANSCAL